MDAHFRSLTIIYSNHPMIYDIAQGDSRQHLCLQVRLSAALQVEIFEYQALGI